MRSASILPMSAACVCAATNLEAVAEAGTGLTLARDGKYDVAIPHCRVTKEEVALLTKYTRLELWSSIERPLADARGSDRSHDRQGVVFAAHDTAFMKSCTKLPEGNK